MFYYTMFFFKCILLKIQSSWKSYLRYKFSKFTKTYPRKLNLIAAVEKLQNKQKSGSVVVAAEFLLI